MLISTVRRTIRPLRSRECGIARGRRAFGRRGLASPSPTCARARGGRRADAWPGWRISIISSAWTRRTRPACQAPIGTSDSASRWPRRLHVPILVEREDVRLRGRSANGGRSRTRRTPRGMRFSSGPARTSTRMWSPSGIHATIRPRRSFCGCSVERVLADSPRCTPPRRRHPAADRVPPRRPPRVPRRTAHSARRGRNQPRYQCSPQPCEGRAAAACSRRVSIRPSSTCSRIRLNWRAASGPGWRSRSRAAH